MNLHSRISLVLCVAAAIAAPETAAAQAGVEVGPVVGLYAPVTSFAPVGIYSTKLPVKPSDLSGLAEGAEVQLWFNQRLGIQVQGAVADSRFGGGIFVPAGFVTKPQDAQVVAVTAQVVYRPAPGGLPLQLSAGAGVVHHTGYAYDGFKGLSPVAGTLGIRYERSIGRWFSAALGVTTFLYSLDVRDTGGDFGQQFERGFQVDLLPYLSVTWRSARP